jgi:hypothetical protein
MMDHPKNTHRIFATNSSAMRLELVNNAELVLVAVSGFVRNHDYQRRYQLDHYNIPCRKARPAERLEHLSCIDRTFAGLLPDE